MKKSLKCLIMFMVMVVMLSITVVYTAATPNTNKSSAYLKFVAKEGNTITLDLCVNDVSKLGIAQIAFELSHSDNLSVVNCINMMNFGFLQHSIMPSSTASPFKVLWINGIDILPYEETVITRLVLKFEGDLDNDKSAFLTLNLDPENLPATPYGEEIIDGINIVSNYTVNDFKCNTEVGDVNSDERINLTDVSFMLKYIAKWSNIDINLEEADIVNDSKVNLTDVSSLLKYIAGWTDVRLGHSDSITVIEASTCQKKGKSVLKCKICELEEITETSVVSCNYKKAVVKEATCGKDGQEKFTCTMCGDSYTKTIKATGKHNYKKTVVSTATCTTDGKDKYTCSVCGDSYFKTTKATGKHNYSSGKCTVCGKADPNATSDLQKFCTWLTKNGKCDSNGDYYVSKFVGEFYISVTYDVSDNELVIGNVFESSNNIYLTGIVAIPLNSTSTVYDFAFFSTGKYNDVSYFSGWETMSAKEFCGKGYLDYDHAYSDVLDTYDSDIEEAGWNNIDFALTVAADLIKDSGTGLTLAQLGFIGY